VRREGVLGSAAGAKIWRGKNEGGRLVLTGEAVPKGWRMKNGI
jgi:hypothetical protein